MDPSLHKNLISTKEAGEISGYSPDYLARLARSGKILGRRVGHSWLVDRVSLSKFIGTQDDRKIDRARSLARARMEEYRVNRTPYRTLVNQVHKVLPSGPIEIPSSFKRINRSMRLPVRKVASHAYASLMALLIVVSGALVARADYIPNAAHHIALIANETASGFADTFGDIPSRIAFRFNVPALIVNESRDRVAEEISESTENISSPTLAQPDLAFLQMQFSDNMHFAFTPATDNRQPITSALVTPRDLQMFAVQIISLATSPQDVLSAITTSYKTLGEKSYRAIRATFDAYLALVNGAGINALSLGTEMRDAVAQSPLVIRDINLAFVGAIANATHASIRADVSLAYGLSAAGSASARIAVALIGSTGDAIARMAAESPHIAADAFLRATQIPTVLAPAIAEGAFNTEYAAATRFVAVTNRTTENYISAVKVAGDLVYTAENAGHYAVSVSRDALVKIPLAIEDSYLGTLGKSALALTTPLKNVLNTPQIAAAVTAAKENLNTGERVALTTYEIIHSLATSAGNALTFLFGSGPQIVLAPNPIVPKVRVATSTRVVAVTSYPTYTTVVRGVSQDDINQSLASMRNGILGTVAGMIQPVAAQSVTNMTTIQQVNMIQDLSNLIVRNGDFRGGTWTGGTMTSGVSVAATTGTFDNLTAGTFTNTGAISSSGIVTAPNFVATSTTATSTFAGRLAIGTSTPAGNGLFTVGTSSPLLYIDGASGRLGLGTSSPAVSFDIYATDAMRLPVGSTAQRPGTGDVGYVRYNTTTHQFEGYGDNSVWQGLGGVIDADQSTKITADTNNADEDTLRFFTADVERMVIGPTGLLGIGTTSPFARISLTGLAGDATNLFAISTSTASATTTAFTINRNGDIALLNGSNLSVGGNLTVTGTQTYTGLATFTNGFLANASSTVTSGLFSMNGGASTTQLTTTGSTYLATTGGNVGIGTTSPSDTFALNGAAYLADISAPAVSTNRLYSNIGNLYWAGNLIGGASVGNWATDGTNVWRPGGNVGIGTTSPYSMLSVAGQIVGAYFTATSTTASTFATAPILGTLTGLVGANNGTLYQIATSTNFVTSLAQTYGTAQTGAITLATSTTAISNDWGITNSSGTFTFNLPTATASIRGLLSGADWTTFNNKQATISATWPITLTGATVGFNGLSTSTAAVVGNIPYFSGANTFANVATSSLALGTGLNLLSGSLGYQIGGSAVTIKLADTAVTPSSYGSSTAIPTFTVDQQGRLTAAGTAVVVAPAGTLTGTTLASNVVTSSLTSVGTIATGVWNGTTIAVANGGTGTTTAPISQLLYGGSNNTYQSVATSSASCTSGVSCSAFTVVGTVSPSITNTGLLSLAQTSGTAQTGAITLATSTTAISNDWGITNSSGTFTFNLPTATASIRGLLSGTDWTTFNNKQAAGNYITALTGDVTAAGPGSAAATLATVASAGTSGSSTAIPVITINAKGLTTLITTAAVVAPAGTLTGTTLASNVVTSSLTSVGTIATGVWNGSTIAVANGGTGTTTAPISQLLYGGSNNTYQSVATSSASCTSGVSCSAFTVVGTVSPSITNTGLLSLAQTYGTAQTGAITLATSTTAISNDWGITNSSGTFTFNLPTATASIRGLLSGADWTTFNNKQATISATWPITLTGATVGFNGLSTSTAAVVGNIPYFSSANTFANVATSSLALGTGLNLLSGSLGYQIGGSAVTIKLADTAVTPSSYGSSTAIPTFTVDQQGRLTAAGTAVVVAPAGTLTGTTLASNVVTSSLTSVGTIATGVWNGTTIAVANGGTGTTTAPISQLLYGGSNNTYQSVATSSASCTTGVSCSAFTVVGTVSPSITNTGLLSLAQTYGTAQTGAITLATSTTAISNDWGITNSSGTFTFNLPTATASVRGLLSGTDWTTFNSKQATISATWPITLSGAAVGFDGLSTSTAAVVGNIPYFSSANTFANVATSSIALGTSLSVASGALGYQVGGSNVTLNTIQGIRTADSPTFAGLTLTAFSGAVSASAGVLSAGTLSVANGGTGATTLTGLLQGNGTGAITGITGTAGQFPYYNGTNTLLATSSVFLATTGNVGIGTTTPGSLLSLGNTGNDTINISATATSTFGSGLNLRTGCFAINGTCVGGGGGTPGGSNGQLQFNNSSAFGGLSTSFYNSSLGTLGLGTTTPQWLLQLSTSTAPQLALSDGSLTSNHWTFRNAGGFLYIATSSPSTFATSSMSALTINTNGYLGIGTTTPYAPLSVNGLIAGANFNADNASATSTFAGGLSAASSLYVLQNGNVGIGTTGPGYKLDISGEARATTAFRVGTSASTLFGTDNAVRPAAASAYLNLLGGVGNARISIGDSVIAIATGNGLEKVRIDSSGNVGIGTTTPSGKLAVSGGASIGADYNFAPPTNGLIIQGNVGIGTTTPGSLLSLNSLANFTTATSTFYSTGGINLAAGCFAINGTCVGGGGGAVSSVSNSDGTLTISPTTGAVVASLNLGNANTWTGLQQFGNASTTLFSSYGPAYFGATATSSFSSAGALTLITPLLPASGGTGATTLTGLLQGNGTSAITAITGTAGQFPYYNGTNTLLATSSVFLATTGNVGIGTTTPGSLLSLGNTGNDTINISATATSTFGSGLNLRTGCFAINGTCVGGGGGTPGGSNGQLQFNNSSAFGGLSTSFYNSSLGTLGLGTTTPQWLLQLSTSTAPQLALSDGSLTSNHWTFRNAGGFLYIATSSPSTFATSSMSALTINTNGYLGIGTTTPYAPLSVNGLIAGANFNADNASATSTFAGGLNVGGGSLLNNFSTGETSIGSLLTGTQSFDTDAGIVQWADLPLSSAASGAIESYSAMLNGSPMLTIYGTSGGSGSLINPGIAIGTSTPPYAMLSIAGRGTGASTTVEVFNSASTTIERLLDNGTKYFLGSVGIGTTTPGSLLSLNSLANFTTATSTFYSTGGINLAAGCFAINGTCVGGGGGGVTSVSNANGTLTISPTTGAVVASLALGNANSWTALQQFTNASTTLFSSYGPAYFGATATSSFSSAGALTLITPLLVGSGGTGATTLTGLLQGNGTSALTGITGTAGQFPYYNGTNTLLATSTVFLATTGNVGIGTTNPLTTLHVNGPAIMSALVLTSSSTAYSTLTSYGGFDGYVNASGGIGTGGNDSVLNAQRLTAYGNLTNIGSIQAGETRLTSAGTFAAKVDYTTGTSPFSVAVGDVNGDGKADLAVSNSGSGTVSVFINNGSGTFAAKVDYTTGTTPYSVAIGDLNGDGKADLAVANGGSATVSVFINNGNGTFAAKVDYTTGTTPISVAIGDLNGDGKADLAVANYSSNKVSVFINNGNGTFAAKVDYTTGSLPASVAIGDVSGDGKADLAVANLSSNTVSVFINNGNGTFAAKVDYTMEFLSSPNSVAIGDLNGDGKADLAVAKQNGTVSVFINNGDGTFAAKVDYTAGTTSYSVAIGDLNGDGKADLAVANGGSATVSVFINNGNGTFAAKVDYTTGTGPRSVSIGDVNGDGKTDLAVANYDSATVSVFINNLTTMFYAQASTGSVGIGTTSPYAKLSVAGRGVFDQDIRFDYFTATSTTATSTIAGFLDVNGTGTNATSTFASNLWVKGTLRTGTGSMYLNDSGLTSSDGNISLNRSGISYLNGGNVGIGTSTPQWLLQLSTSTAPQLALGDGSLTSAKWMFRNAGGFLYIATSSPSTFATSTMSALTINTNGYLGIGTTTPYAPLSVNGLIAGANFNADNASATSTFAGGLNVGGGSLLNNFSTGETSITSLITGTDSFDVDAGTVQWTDIPINAAAAGSVQSYTAYLGGNPMITVYGLSNAASTTVNNGIAIGTSTPPYAMLSIAGRGTGASTTVEVFNSASTTIERLLDNGTKYFLGNVGIATTSPWRTLSVAGTAAFNGLTTDTADSKTLCLTSGGEVVANTGTTCITSSQRFKNTIVPLDSSSGLSEVMKFNPVSFQYNSDTGVAGGQVGFIAEQMQQVDPRLVVLDGSGAPFTVRYENLTAVLTKAVQELADRVATTTLSLDSLVAATSVRTSNLAVTNEAFVGNLTAGVVASDAFLAPQNNFTSVAINLGFASTTAPSAVLTADGAGVDIYKLSIYNLGNIEALAAKVNGIDTRITALETRMNALESGAISSASGSPISLSSSTLASALEGFDVLIKKGIAQFNTLVFRQLVASKDADGTSSAGSVSILAGNTVAQVNNSLVATSTKVFITFGSQVAGSWWVSDKTAGSFRVVLSAPQTADVSFDYFLVQTESQTATSTPPSLPPPPAPSVPTESPQPQAPSVEPTASSTQPTVDSQQPAASATPADTIAPVVTLTGAAAMEIEQNATFTDPGATAVDDTDGDLTNHINVSGAVDSATLGLYTLTYSATDAAGNIGSVSRVVTVIAPAPAPTEPPVPADAPPTTP